MRVRRWVLVVALAGCGRWGFAEVARDSAPSPDSGGADGSAGDDDGDGIANTVDNCQGIANPNQYNEDGDRFGDACDPCPPFADDTPPDGDGDGVGDACDPDPNAPGDAIVRFEGFQGGLPAGWTRTGTWAAAAGRAAATSGANSEDRLLVGASLGTRDWIGARVTIDRIHGTSARTAGVVDMFTSGGEGVLCAPGRNADMDGGVAGIHIVDVGAALPLDTATTAFAEGASYDLAFVRAGTGYDCTGDPGSGGSVTASATYQRQPSSPLVGLRTRNVEATFDWVMVVTEPGP